MINIAMTLLFILSIWALALSITDWVKDKTEDRQHNTSTNCHDRYHGDHASITPIKTTRNNNKTQELTPWTLNQILK